MPGKSPGGHVESPPPMAEQLREVARAYLDLQARHVALQTRALNVVAALRYIHDDPIPANVRAQLADLIAELTDACKEA